jgi:hypothetical protein
MGRIFARLQTAFKPEQKALHFRIADCPLRLNSLMLSSTYSLDQTTAKKSQNFQLPLPPGLIRPLATFSKERSEKEMFSILERSWG